jgi:hypothetical protein
VLEARFNSVLGAVEVTDEDWQLAGIIRETSDAVQHRVKAAVAAAEAKKEGETAHRLARREVVKIDVTSGHRIAECAKRIKAKVAAQPGRTKRDIYTDLRHWRDVFDDGLDHAVTQGWVHESKAGSARELHPGKEEA